MHKDFNLIRWLVDHNGKVKNDEFDFVVISHGNFLSYEDRQEFLAHKKCFTLIILIVQFFLCREKNQQLFCVEYSEKEKELN